MIVNEMCEANCRPFIAGVPFGTRAKDLSWAVPLPAKSLTSRLDRAVAAGLQQGHAPHDSVSLHR
jgi:hypothetical protein